MKQKLFTFFLALVASVSTIYASDTQVDGIWYDFDSSTETASVTNGRYYYSGSVIIPEMVTYNGTTYSVTSIGVSAFRNCSSLTSVTIPNSVTSIGSGAFSSCSGLPSVTIPNSVTSIGDNAFSGCSGLTSVVWNAENCADMSAGDDYPFGEKNSQITSFTFGDKVQHIPSNLCYNMRNLTSITIPNSVTSIEQLAFSRCSSLTSVIIGNSVASIGNSAFSGCSSLNSITSKATTPPTLGGDVFKNIDNTIPVYVPCGSISAYKSDARWNYFTNIQSSDQFTITIQANKASQGTVSIKKK